MSAHRPEKVRAWRATIDAWMRSGQTVNDFCRARRITRSYFDRWRRILATDPVISPPTPIPTSSSAFVPVRVVAESMAEVVLRSGVVVRVPLGAAADAIIRTLYAVECDIKVEREMLGEKFTDADVVRVRRARAGPILAAFADWLDAQHRSATPKSLFGHAIAYSRNQWASLVRYLDDARFAIDNWAAERAIRPLALGRVNWLHVGGDGGLKTASVLLSICASATRHRLNPWSYLRDVFGHLAVRSAGADLSDLLPDAPAQARSRLAA